MDVLWTYIIIYINNQRRTKRIEKFINQYIVNGVNYWTTITYIRIKGKELTAYVETQKLWADAFSKYTGNIVPQIQSSSGSNGSNGATQFMEMMGAKAAKDLSLDLTIPRGK